MCICTCVLSVMRRAQTQKLLEVQCEKGARGEQTGVVPGLPAGSQCPELAQHVDTEPEPDLKPKGKRCRDSGIRATSASYRRAGFSLSVLPSWT